LNALITSLVSSTGSDDPAAGGLLEDPTMAPLSREQDCLNARIEVIEAAHSEDPSPRTFAPLAEAYRLCGRLEEALATSEEGVRAHPDHVGIRIVRARALAEAGRREKALEAYGQVLKRDPDNLEAQSYVSWADAPRGVGTPEQGTRRDGDGRNVDQGASEQAETGTPQRSGTLSEELGRIAALFAPLPGVVEADRQECEPSGIATLTLAEIYSRQGLPDKAAEVCEQILEREPDNERARSALEGYLSRLAAASQEQD
jgi:tetratricopeptide (TPR) repeat protein